MAKSEFKLKFWGTRGSIPVSGPEYHRYGGNTSCIEVRCGPHRLIFDAGSGIREAGEALLADGIDHCDLFFTHSHYDHMIGLPYFMPIYRNAMHVTHWSGHLAGKMTTHEMIKNFIRPPWFPIESETCRAQMDFKDFHVGDVLTPQEGITIRTAPLDHPGGCVGYRIEWADKVIALIYDTEHRGDKLDPNVITLIDSADLVVYDCTYTQDEMPKYLDYGHSTWNHGVKLMNAANAKMLAMFHHAPNRTDDELDALEILAQTEFPNSFAARDRQVVKV